MLGLNGIMYVTYVRGIMMWRVSLFEGGFLGSVVVIEIVLNFIDAIVNQAIMQMSTTTSNT